MKGSCYGNKLILWQITNTDWYHHHSCAGVPQRTGILPSKCMH